MMQSIILMVIGALICLFGVALALGAGAANERGDDAKAELGIYCAIGLVAIGVTILVIA